MFRIIFFILEKEKRNEELVEMCGWEAGAVGVTQPFGFLTALSYLRVDALSSWESDGWEHLESGDRLLLPCQPLRVSSPKLLSSIISSLPQPTSSPNYETKMLPRQTRPWVRLSSTTPTDSAKQPLTQTCTVFLTSHKWHMMQHSLPLLHLFQQLLSFRFCLLFFLFYTALAE